MRERYANVVAVLVTAPADVLAARLAGRDRPSDGAVTDRMKRVNIAREELRPDVVIDNVGEPESGARKLLDAVYTAGALAS